MWKHRQFLDTAKAENASIIGLSALMTTTMMEMKEVVDEAKAGRKSQDYYWRRSSDRKFL